MQRSGIFSKSLYKPSVIGSKAQERTQLSKTGWTLPSGHCTNLLWVCRYSLGRDYMAQILHFLLEETAFLKPQLYVAGNDQTPSLVAGGAVQKNWNSIQYNIIQIQQKGLELLITKNYFHQSLESTGHITQPKEHSVIFKEPKRCTKRSLLFILFCNRNLVVATSQVKSGKPFSTC